ncbi:MAG TPA: GntR family transcriptional regulator [Syntrophomonadaceae bacterium]|nr:GntR family transcriptional regulator [Syntrophomonadaceae bacterium]
MDFNKARPIYQQIIDAYKKALARGDIGPGDRILSQREYAQKIKVNPNTVQRAYREMEMMGMVATIRGQGTFIVPDPEMQQKIKKEMAEQVLTYFIEEMHALGFKDEEICSLLEEKQKSSKEVVADD